MHIAVGMGGAIAIAQGLQGMRDSWFISACGAKPDTRHELHVAGYMYCTAAYVSCLPCVLKKFTGPLVQKGLLRL